jgi:staphylococcal nuclease domain-containing protein 1
VWCCWARRLGPTCLNPRLRLRWKVCRRRGTYESIYYYNSVLLSSVIVGIIFEYILTHCFTHALICTYAFNSLASKSNNNVDEPGAFPAREWLRSMVVGKTVSFETRKQGASAGDRVYGWLFVDNTATDEKLHLAVECVRLGHATPKVISNNNTNNNKAEEPPSDYEVLLTEAYAQAKEAGVGIHAAAPLVRSIATDIPALTFVGHTLRCVVEYVFDGSRLRVQVIDDAIRPLQYATITILIAGVTCPRIGNVKQKVADEPFAEQARQFVQSRLLQRELDISFVGADKAGACAVATLHHPKGSIAVELLQHGLAKMTDWSARCMPVAEVPALRVAENTAKRALIGVWHAYAPPALSSAAELRGTVVEVLSGDTFSLLPVGTLYKSDNDVIKISLASVRAPRVGSDRAGRPDEPYAMECKDKLRLMTVGKEVIVNIHYEREIPVQPGVTEKRPCGTVSVGKHEDVSQVLINEGLATTQFHRDDDPRSPRYDELRAAEAVAKAAKKGLHKEGEYKPGVVNDLTVPTKAKAYSGSLLRAGKIKGTVDFVFNGAYVAIVLIQLFECQLVFLTQSPFFIFFISLFKIHIPAENCYIRFSPNCIRCPQPSPSPGSKQQARPAEPFGDEAKFHARLFILQRQVEIECTGVTTSGIITGNMFIGFGPTSRDYTIELLGAGLASVDQRKIDYGEAPKSLIDAQTAAQQCKVGIWSLEKPAVVDKVVKTSEKSKETVIQVRLSEIRSGNHFFFQVATDEASKVVEDSMKLFTQNHGTSGAPCDVKVGKVVAALFDDGTGKSWYRAKIVERKGPGKVAVLYIDHGNVATVAVSTHLRPLDMSLGVERIPAVAREATLALIMTRSLDTDEGVDAARFFQSISWGKELSARLLAPDDSGKLAVALSLPDQEETINAQLVSEGLARVAKQANIDLLASKMSDGGNSVVELAAELNVAQDEARKSRYGMWRYGDVGDDDPDQI